MIRAGREEITRVVHDAMRSRLPTLRGQTIAGDKSLEDYGADSVDRIEIILTILDQLDASQPLSEFSNLADIDEMVDYLCSVTQA